MRTVHPSHSGTGWKSVALLVHSIGLVLSVLSIFAFGNLSNADQVPAYLLIGGMALLAVLLFRVWRMLREQWKHERIQTFTTLDANLDQEARKWKGFELFVGVFTALLLVAHVLVCLAVLFVMRFYLDFNEYPSGPKTPVIILSSVATFMLVLSVVNVFVVIGGMRLRVVESDL